MYAFRTNEERAAIAERAAANRAWMAKTYAKPRSQAPVVLTALDRAIIAGDLEAVRANLMHDQVNQATITGLTPLHLACFGYAQVRDTPAWHRANMAGKKTPQETIVDLLLAHGAQVDVWDAQHRVPAACCDGKGLPPSLVEAMRKKMEETAFVLEWMKNTKDSPEAHVLNAFFAKCDINPDSKQGRN
jgi:hypothetical protein